MIKYKFGFWFLVFSLYWFMMWFIIPSAYTDSIIDKSLDISYLSAVTYYHIIVSSVCLVVFLFGWMANKAGY